MKVAYTPGCWDLLHIGHLRYLEHAAQFGDLIVGVASDAVCELDKGERPVIDQEQRLEMVRGLRTVSDAQIYWELDFVGHLETYEPNAMVVSSTWGADVRHLRAEAWCRANDAKIIRLGYMEAISTSLIKERIRWLG